MTRKILIVDDSKLARMAIIKALDSVRPGWSTIEAGDAATALEVLRHDAPDIALLDFNMPGKDGVTLAAEMRPQVPQIKVAVISANQQVEVVARVHAAGAAFLPKPITAKALGSYLDDLTAPQRGVP